MLIRIMLARVGIGKGPMTAHALKVQRHLSALERHLRAQKDDTGMALAKDLHKMAEEAVAMLPGAVDVSPLSGGLPKPEEP